MFPVTSHGLGDGMRAAGPIHATTVFFPHHYTPSIDSPSLLPSLKP